MNLYSEVTSMKVKDCMTTGLPTVAPGDSMGNAAVQMVQSGAKALAVVDNGRLVGVITDWDLTCALAQAEKSGAAVGDRHIQDVMSSDLVTAGPDDVIVDVSATMAEAQRHHLLVQEDGRYIGMLHLDVDWSNMCDGMSMPNATFNAPI